MTVIDIPAEFGYVILGQIAAVFTLQYLGGKVMAARKKYQVTYPDMYSTDPTKKEFNCVQRGHQNALETYPTFIILNVLAGFRHPVPAAALAIAWCVGRIAFMKGYATGKPDQRYSYGGHLHYIGLVGSLLLSGHLALHLLGFL